MKQKILLADASATTTEVMSFVMERNGYTISIANTQEETLEEFHKGNINILLIDLDMYTEDLILEIQKLKKQDCHIFLLSDKTDFQLKKQAKESGVIGWIAKPFIPDKFAKTLIKFINNKIPEKKPIVNLSKYQQYTVKI